MINNEYDLLKFLVSIMDENNTVNAYVSETESNIDVPAHLDYINSLKSQNLINTDLTNIYITSKGLSYLQKESEKAAKQVFDKNDQHIFAVLKWGLGIITAVIIAAIIYWFGLN